MGTSKHDHDVKKKKKVKKSNSKKKDKNGRSGSLLKETGSFERVLNSYCNSGSVNHLNDEQWLNLAIELKPLDELIDDRDRLMSEVFAIIGGDQQLNELLPEVIRKANHSSEELKDLLVNECKKMTEDEILEVLKGKKAVTPANQLKPPEEKKPATAVEKVTTDDLTKSFLQVSSEASGEPTPSQMELLELEMRARAIKSLMHKQVPPTPVNDPQQEGRSTGAENATSSLTTPPETSLPSPDTEVAGENEANVGNNQEPQLCNDSNKNKHLSSSVSPAINPSETVQSSSKDKSNASTCSDKPDSNDCLIEPVHEDEEESNIIVSTESIETGQNSANGANPGSGSGSGTLSKKAKTPLSKVTSSTSSSSLLPLNSDNDVLITEISDEEMEPL